MKMKTVIAAAVAGVFAMPLAAQASADHDSMILAQASGGSGGMAPGGAAPGAPGSGATGGTGAGAGTGAPGTGPVPPTALSRLDKNQDGYVSREEAMGDAEMQSRFSELDADNDGRISRAEWEAGQGAAGTGATTR